MRLIKTTVSININLKYRLLLFVPYATYVRYRTAHVHNA